MAWLAPRTWVAGEVVTASLLNVNLRDQLAYLGENGAILSTPPALPRDGQLWIYPADAANAIYWQFRYIAALGAWVFVGGPPLIAVAGSASSLGACGSTSSTTYVDLSSNAAITLARAGVYVVEADGMGGSNQVGFWLSVFLNTTAVDTDAVDSNTGGAARPRSFVFTASAGAVVKFQHRSASGASAPTHYVRLRITPRRIT